MTLNDRIMIENQTIRHIDELFTNLQTGLSTVLIHDETRLNLLSKLSQVRSGVNNHIRAKGTTTCPKG